VLRVECGIESHGDIAIRPVLARVGPSHDVDWVWVRVRGPLTDPNKPRIL